MVVMMATSALRRLSGVVSDFMMALSLRLPSVPLSNSRRTSRPGSRMNAISLTASANAAADSPTTSKSALWPALRPRYNVIVSSTLAPGHPLPEVAYGQQSNHARQSPGHRQELPLG